MKLNEKQFYAVMRAGGEDSIMFYEMFDANMDYIKHMLRSVKNELNIHCHSHKNKITQYDSRGRLVYSRYGAQKTIPSSDKFYVARSHNE